MRRKVLISVHDVTPAHAGRLDRVFGVLRSLVGGRMALLVVPDWHGDWPIHRHPAFVETLHELVEAGAEIVLHGYRHDEVGHRRSFADTLRVFGRTAASAEFMFLTSNEAAARVDRGLALFEKLGFRPVGFVPPAWLFGRYTRDVLRDRNLDMTESFWRITNLSSEVSRFVPVLSWSTARAWRSRMTAGVADARVWAERARALVRVAIHPPDLTIPVVARSLESSLRRLLANREPVSYSEAIKG
jgi:predicted deacetylase